jgi:hypothetical protein
MKLAEVKNPKLPKEILEYAAANNFRPIEIHTSDETVDILSVILAAIEYAKSCNCIEFCFRDISSQYNFNSDGTRWTVKLVGFRALDVIEEE